MHEGQANGIPTPHLVLEQVLARPLPLLDNGDQLAYSLNQP